MSNDIAIKAEKVGKMYRIFDQPQDRLKDGVFWRWGKRYGREFWALRDVSFEVKKGESVGIIGRNGSGKSTLLQIIAGTLQPTSGSVQVNGRVAALLELGSGFNPEYTGRENVYMNAAILGLTREESDARFDAIASFADIGQFLDQPVKTYSSGMMMRLAFAVATAVDPNILIVDEALAVGDAAFQLKCYNRLKKLLEAGIALVLVTHETQTIRTFSTQAIWLNAGAVTSIGHPRDVASAYVQYLFEAQTTPPKSDLKPTTSSSESSSSEPTPPFGIDRHRSLRPLEDNPSIVRWGSGDIRFTGFHMDSGIPKLGNEFAYGERLHIECSAQVQRDISSLCTGFGIAFRTTKGVDVITATTYDQRYRFQHLRAKQNIHISFELDNILAPGEYALVLVADDRAQTPFHYYDFIENAWMFKVFSSTSIFSMVLPAVEQHITVSGQPREAAT